MTNFKKWPLLLRFSTVPLVCVLLTGLYILSVLWRVSCAEEKYFGRSCLIPLKRHERQFIFPPTAASYGTYTYPYPRDGKAVFVYKQLINGFQHSYGSALVALEFGDRIADLLFRANEYCEGYLESDKGSMKHYLDTVKDLENNKIGRQIGKAARHNHFRGRKAEKYIVASVVDAVDRDVVINHYLDPRVRQLPTLEQYGCPFLPKPVLAQANNTNGQTFTISGNRSARNDIFDAVTRVRNE